MQLREYPGYRAEQSQHKCQEDAGDQQIPLPQPLPGASRTAFCNLRLCPTNEWLTSMVKVLMRPADGQRNVLPAESIYVRLQQCISLTMPWRLAGLTAVGVRRVHKPLHLREQAAHPLHDRQKPIWNAIHMSACIPHVWLCSACVASHVPSAFTTPVAAAVELAS